MYRDGPAGRLHAPDMLRGVIMLVMALDHANLFIAHQHPAPEMWTGPLPTYPDALTFLTRLVTHLAAPGFFLLMGVGMVLFADSRRKLGWTTGAIVRHLIVRGVLLILLQFWVEDPAWFFASVGKPMLPGSQGPVYVGVLYGLGASMIVGAVLLWLNTGWLVGVSLAAVLATQVLISDVISRYAPISIPLRLLLVPGQTGNVLVYYPLVPWLGLMGLGMILGRQLLKNRDRAYRLALVIGLAFLALFLVVRGARGWGNIRFAPGSDWIASLNLVKYPPSLAFILLTLGVDLVLLAVLSRARSGARWLQPLRVFGSSALFFYIAHLYLYGVIGATFGLKSLGQMYLIWLMGLVVLYPLCWGFGKFKHRQAPQSLWRLF